MKSGRKIVMPHSAILSQSTDRTAPTNRSVRTFVVFILGLWLALGFILGASGALINRPGTPPFAVLAAVVVPIAIFLLAYWSFRPFHDFIVSADISLLAATQSWRFAGAGFIALNLFGLLPGYFAWPAGLGDMVIGVTAPWVAVALARKEHFASSKTFIIWNVFGIFDFAVLAVGTGAMAPLFFPSLLHMVTAQMVTAAPMRHLPLSLVPTFLVPMFTIFHLIALFQTRHLRGFRE